MPSKRSRAAARWAARSSGARNACGVWTPTSGSTAGQTVGGDESGQRYDGDGSAMHPGGGDRRLEERPAGKGSGAVMDRDDVDRAGLDVGGQHRQGVPLRPVPGLAAVEDRDLVVAQVRSHGVGHHPGLTGLHDQHHAAYVGQRERVADRPDQHRCVEQREQHLVDRRARPGAGAGSEDHDGSGHGREANARLRARWPAPPARPLRPRPRRRARRTGAHRGWRPSEGPPRTWWR